MATTSKETQSKTEGNLDQVADRIREFNERIIESSKQAGEVTLSAYAKTLQSIAELQGNVGKASPVDWLTTFATAQASFTRDLAEAYTAAARKLGGDEQHVDDEAGAVSGPPSEPSSRREPDAEPGERVVE